MTMTHRNNDNIQYANFLPTGLYHTHSTIKEVLFHSLSQTAHRHSLHKTLYKFCTFFLHRHIISKEIFLLEKIDFHVEKILHENMKNKFKYL